MPGADYLIGSCLCPTLSDTFKDKNVGYASSILEVRPKSAISTRKRVYEHPRFHVAKRPYRRDSCPFRRRSLPLFRHLENFWPVI